MIAPHFLYAQARRLGLVAEVSASSDEAEQQENEAQAERGAGSYCSSDKCPSPKTLPSPSTPDVPDHCMVKDLNTGEVYHAEKEGKTLLKRYQVADPRKLLDNGWWGVSPPVTMPPPMFRLSENDGDAESSNGGTNGPPSPAPSPSKSGGHSPSRQRETGYENFHDGGVTEELHEASVLLPDSAAELTFLRVSGTGTARDLQGGAYTAYFVEVKCLGAEPPQWRVYRRYREFKTLDEELRKAGYHAPLLPPRKLMGLLDPDFVEQRRVDLESWLYQLVDYPNMDPAAADPQHFEPFRAFLLADADNPPFDMEVHDDEGRGGDAAVAAWGELGEAQAEPEEEAGGPGEVVVRQKVGLAEFDLVRVIGKGSFGKVTLVRKKSSGRYYAMKVLAKAHLEKSKQIEHTRTERRVLGCINHPFIVSMHYAWTTAAKIYFVLDYCPGGELFFHLSKRKKLPEYMARFYAAEITLALEHLHDNDIVYRDLKPENIILDAEGHVKLADFGLAKTGVRHCASGATSLCGTPEYLSPEILNRRGHGTAVDWWGLGMVLYECLTGLPPWYTTDRKKLFQRLRHGALTFPYYVSRPAADAIAGFLTRDPQARLGAAGRGPVEIKEHPFFRSVDWDALLRQDVKPPFNPCKLHVAATDTRNFDKQFTRLPLESASEGDGSLGSGAQGWHENGGGGGGNDPQRSLIEQWRSRAGNRDDYVGFTYRGSALFGNDQSRSRHGGKEGPPEWLDDLDDQQQQQQQA
ncbi:kinase-like domain-containing protein [Tribonema minus]|uniref:Kinase-like domain-containing protein n=1 Tax=Tribonema minus TaxID=303371 RepID=A0A835YQR0_9STRA|nr:kinase-like domain-containing protein [Tribonema minus]